MSKWLFFLLLTAESFIFSQIKIEGKVFDKDTKTPMPYAFLINKNANYGAITNEDGYFTIICLPTDSLTVSFVGYQTQKVPVSYFTNHTIFYLKEKVNALNTVSVFGNVDMDMYLTLLMKAKRNLLATKPYKSKTYFTLESSANDIPIELLECYYNAELYHQGIKRLGLKNGRIGIAEIDQSYFVSLHTTHVLQNLKLSMKSNSDFPLSPLHFSPVRQKRLFDINLLSLNEDLFCLQFLAKGKLKELLNAKIWVDRKKGQIRKVELWKEDIGTHPFLEIDESHKMDSLCFRIAYTFDNSDRYMLNNIEFDYHFIYDNTVNSLPISSKGVFLFYEKEASFNLPKNAFSDLSTSDYDKIVSQPYNANFWKYNEVFNAK